MNKSSLHITAFAVAILFFIQLAGNLVESIYILDLMNSRLDEKALGLLFYFAPVLVFPLFKRYPRQLAWALTGILVVARGMLPYVNTSNRMLASGMGTAAVLGLLFLMLASRPKEVPASQTALWGSAGLGLAIVLSVLLRTIGMGLDYSLIPAGGWLGWLLAFLLGGAVLLLGWQGHATLQTTGKPVTSAIVGTLLLLTLVWFSISAPSVIARWTEGHYTLIVIAVSLLSAGWVWLTWVRPHWVNKIQLSTLLLWNILFTLSLAGTLLSQRIDYPTTPAAAPVVVTSPGLITQISLFAVLLLFPVLFLDLRVFLARIAQSAPSSRELLAGFLLGTFLMVALIFFNIFSNVWAYVRPVSPAFRGTFWLAFFVLAGTITLLAWLTGRREETAAQASGQTVHWGWGVLLVTLFLVTAIKALPTERVQAESADQDALVVMTFNTQQSNDDFGERSFDRQLALMRQVDADIIALQESDSARISLNNNDYVRYFAEQLGYYSYYGPTPVAGTFGTAILSRYPLMNTRTVFSYSDTDEIGTSVAEIDAGGRRFTIFNVHPAGSDTADLVFARTLLEQSKDQPYVIALGDFNLRDYEEAYQLIDSTYTNVWTHVYPTEISPDGVDMSGENRIDHIFVSPALEVRNPVYVLPPISTTDHPVHWVEIYWPD